MEMSINIAHIDISTYKSQNIGSTALYKYQILFIVIIWIILQYWAFFFLK